jgi:hypothetical protein
MTPGEGNRMKPLIALCVVFAVCAGCASSPVPAVESGFAKYRNSRDYLLECVREELKPLGGVASEDMQEMTITSEWQVRLSPFDREGMRNRIIVAWKGTDADGWDVTATQETEMNTNQKAPLDREKADWKGTTSDGNLAARFLQNLDRRLRPNEAWKERRAR